MAPPPEYDKEPKAPDKSVTNIPCEDPKALYNLVNEHQTNSDAKSTNSTANAEVENNKHVETLDDGQLRALLDEAITYKCPKDREGKSSLFKELLEEVEQDEQACEAAARLPGRARRGAAAARGRRALPHSNSLQDLVAALAAEPAPRRRHPASHAPQPPVSARALHGGSLPSGVDTSFLLSEEPMRGCGGGVVGAGAEYVATVRCVNPSPLAERRVSASDAHPPLDPDAGARRSKPAFPMTYTARATLEIGSGSVGSGRAVTTTTASNQVRTPPTPSGRPSRRPRGPPHKERTHWDDSEYIDKWYRGLDAYRAPLEQISPAVVLGTDRFYKRQIDPKSNRLDDSGQSRIDPVSRSPLKTNPKASLINATRPKLISKSDKQHIPVVIREREIAVDVEDSKISDHGDEVGLAQINVDENEDAIARTKYRERVGKGLVVPTLSSYNPKNVRNMTIGQPIPHAFPPDKPNQNPSISRAAEDKSIKDKHYQTRTRNSNVTDNTAPTKSGNRHGQTENQNKILDRSVGKQHKPLTPQHLAKPNPYPDVSTNNKNLDQDAKDTEVTEVHTTEPHIEPKTHTDTELVEMVPLKRSSNKDQSNEFSLFIANQQRLLRAIETNNYKEENVNKEDKINIEVSVAVDIKPPEAKNDRPESMESKYIENPIAETRRPLETVSMMDCSEDRDSESPGIELVEMKRTADIKVSDDQPLSASAPSDASIFLSLYKRLLASPCNIDTAVLDVRGAGPARPAAAPDGAAARPAKKKKDKITSRLSRKPHNENSTKKKDLIRNALKKLFFDNITQSDCTKKLTGKAVATASTSKQVDSAIPFSCITTPEVVASCTTTASAQAAAPLDTKMGRSALTSSFANHGGPLPRAGPAFSAAAAVAVAAAEEFKKSLDENGNSVQGFSSPQSGSSQQKKQRRKKSSKNETVIKSHHIDGYQGNKDLNEVLRFIESAEPERPAKRHDDKKKRSAERRKDKPPRASSLDGLRAPPPPARPARPARPAAAPAKPERRSWGDDARDYFRAADPEPDALELTDFQTVTKKRKPRRRAETDAPRPRPPGAAADPDPPSPDRSNDSNDDMDSVHSLPALPSRARAPPPPAPAPVSYADIARTRHHNIPDLIESCNYYAEGEEPPPAAPGDALAYPALDARRRPPKPAPAQAARRPGKPPEPAEPPPPPAPDVVADRRPPVILLDAPARARDLDGVTFGFDVNEQLLGGARRPRCDLVRDAAAAEPPPPRAAPPPLRYVPPAPPPDTHHLHQIIDYVGTAWEEVVRCGGKVRYFSE